MHLRGPTEIVHLHTAVIMSYLSINLPGLLPFKEEHLIKSLSGN